MITSIILNDDKKTYTVKYLQTIEGKLAEICAPKVDIDFSNFTIKVRPIKKDDVEILWTLTIPEDIDEIY